MKKAVPLHKEMKTSNKSENAISLTNATLFISKAIVLIASRLVMKKSTRSNKFMSAMPKTVELTLKDPSLTTLSIKTMAIDNYIYILFYQ